MSQLKSPLDVVKILPQTNCRDCGAPTCLAFAVGVLKDGKPLSSCVHLGPEVLESYQVAGQSRETPEEANRVRAMKEMKARVAAMDFAAVAERLGGRMTRDGLAVKLLGRDFIITESGNIASNCHNNPWVAGPLYSYVIKGTGRDPVGEWLPLRDLPGGEDWHRLFGQMCEKPLKQVMDGYTDLFEYMIEVFEAKRAPDSFESDIAVVIHPLPKVPVMLCYWKPEDGMESSLHMFFDRTATDNLDIDAVYTLGTGLAIMFMKIARTHGR